MEFIPCVPTNTPYQPPTINVASTDAVEFWLETLAVDAVEETTFVVPQGAISIEAFTEKGKQLDVSDSTGTDTYSSGAQVNREPVTIGSSVGSYPETHITFPAGSKGMISYKALSNLGPISNL